MTCSLPLSVEVVDLILRPGPWSYLPLQCCVMVTKLLTSADVLWLSAPIQRSYLYVMQGDFLNEVFSFPLSFPSTLAVWEHQCCVSHPLQALYHLTNLTCRAGVVLLHDNLDTTFSSREADFWLCMES